MKKQEIRTFDITNIQTRSDESANGEQIVTGYAAVFNSPTELWEGLEETIKPGAFSRAILSFLAISRVKVLPPTWTPPVTRIAPLSRMAISVFVGPMSTITVGSDPSSVVVSTRPTELMLGSIRTGSKPAA